MLNKEILNRIIVSRHLFQLAKQSIKSKDDVYLFSTINLLQDSIEVFLLAIANLVNANIRQNIQFDQYFEEINKKISPKELPFRSRLIVLNRLRVNSKHFGIQPPRDECESFITVVKEFYHEVSNQILQADYDSISSLDLIEESESKTHLVHAKKALEAKDYKSCAIECRKAIYVELEYKYDISEFANSVLEKSELVFHKFLCKAPDYAKDPKYISENVFEPTDFIVLDHSVLEQHLLKYAIDSNMFWNVLRLTPSVFKFSNKKWAIKAEFSVLDSENLKEVIPYIYSSTVEIILTVQAYNRSTKARNKVYSEIGLVGENIPIFEKADSESKIRAIMPKGVKKVCCMYSVEGLIGDETYWYVLDEKDKVFIRGYVKNENVEYFETFSL